MTILQAVTRTNPVFAIAIWFGVLAVFYLMFIRPQQMQSRRRKEMLSKLKKGDRVVTLGGLHATIQDVDGEVLALELAANLRVKADRGAVSYVRNKKREEHPAPVPTTPPRA